jgi:hypothetical protein
VAMLEQVYFCRLWESGETRGGYLGREEVMARVGRGRGYSGARGVCAQAPGPLAVSQIFLLSMLFSFAYCPLGGVVSFFSRLWSSSCVCL